jgi:DNA polymerase I-like protein with 3'-5' exonuclease and polymerase domains
VEIEGFTFHFLFSNYTNINGTFNVLPLFRYVETLMGRRRFLSKIMAGNNKEKAKAQRQAVNSICQVTEH